MWLLLRLVRLWLEAVLGSFPMRVNFAEKRDRFELVSQLKKWRRRKNHKIEFHESLVGVYGVAFAVVAE